MTERIDYRLDAETDQPMHFSRGPRRQEADMDITPMIDVTFLLLIFFLVAARLSDDSVLELPTAQNGTAVSNDTSVVVTVTQGDAESAWLYKGDGAIEGTRITAISLEDQQQELEEYIQNGLTVDSKQQVLIKAEIGVKHRDVARVARATGNATARVMYVAVLEER